MLTDEQIAEIEAAAAREDVPTLIAEVRRLRAALLAGAGRDDAPPPYGRECAEAFLRRLLPGEPVFCLRARDELAPDTVESWIASAEDAGVSAAKLGDAYDHLSAMERWRRANRSLVKLPD